MVRVFSIFLLILLAILIYKSDHFVYPIDEVEIISTTSNHSNVSNLMALLILFKEVTC